MDVDIGLVESPYRYWPHMHIFALALALT